MATLEQLKNASNDPRLQACIGKQAIVGLYQFYRDEPVRRDQDFGEIIGIEDGFMALLVQGAKTYCPIQYDALMIAPQGQYTLQATGQVVTNPDFLVSWRLDLADELEQSQWTINSAPHFASIVGKEWDFEYTYDPAYLKQLIESRGRDFIGKTIIIGLSEYETSDSRERKLVKQSQLYGEIIRVNPSDGVIVKLKDGSEYRLPPDISMLQAAPPDTYTLQSTGEMIDNPDLMTLWTLDKTVNQPGT